MMNIALYLMAQALKISFHCFLLILVAEIKMGAALLVEKRSSKAY